MLLAYERALEARVVKAYAAASKRIGRAYLAGGEAAAVRAVRPFLQYLQQVLAAGTSETGKAFADRLVKSEKASHAWSHKTSFEDLDAGIDRHLRAHTAQRVAGISAAMQQTIRDVIERGIANRSSTEEIAAEIVDATGGEIAIQRARRIARTEVHNAAMYGQQAAAEASPLQFTKEWLSTEDQRTRYSHHRANAQRVDLETPFQVLIARDAEHDDGRTEPMMFPGDLDASPGNTINCRCVVMYQPKLIDDAAPAERYATPTTTRPEDLRRPEYQFPGGVPLPFENIEVTLDVELPPEREQRVVWSLSQYMSLTIPLFDSRRDLEALAGQTVQLRGLSVTYDSPAASRIASFVANADPGALRNWLRDFRVGLWRITVPAGDAFPQGFLNDDGGAQVWNASVGRFPAIPLMIDSVEQMTWSDVLAEKREPIAEPGPRDRVMVINATMDLAPLELHVPRG